MANIPLISIITVVYNGIHSIKGTILSVISQSYKNIEFIVIDGGSSDGTIDIITEYRDHITFWASEKDTGIYNAMNKGIQKANGDWICFLNSGDTFVNTDTVSNVVREINKISESIEIIYGNILIRTQNGNYKEKVAKEPCNLQRMHFCHQSAFVKSNLLKKYLFDETYKLSADLKFFKQCFYDNHQSIHLNFPVVIYDTEGISNTNRQAGLKENIEIIKEIDKGLNKFLFLIRLYFVIYWRKLTGKK